MAVTTDDLSAPLGQDRPRRRRFQLPFTAPQALTALFGLFLATFLGFAIFNNNPLGGEPIATVTYKAPSSGDKSAPPSTMAPQAQAPAGEAQNAAGKQTVTIIDGSSGSRQDVVIGGGSDGAAKSDDSSAPAADINPKLLEASRFGMIPTVAGSLKPFRAYAAGSDAERARAAKTPSIAIVITGLGVGAAKTTEAILKLPGAVTLAFTPYGADPAKLVTRARAQKHEVLLQVPMEPFDYPDNDPGPQTLLTSLGPEQNLDRLAWHMSRFQGYVGIANFMGSRLLASDAVMKPIIQDAGKRGLAYLDDGSVSRSVAGVLADSISMPYAKADVTIDTLPTPLDIDRSLAKLETLARERGSAIGVASALPVSIERIGNWAKQLEARGIMLVPLTTVMLKPKSS
ncbi:divergent polysaccharide deacetylase family protein [Bradyrhizobium sp. SYSU BS000235]|uniref:divergent polysaccharide deacetylase family protein n=1 Tax=Bradyrhizobium sp. SYSU BS000235 TaxID=3411332 RepID=UPI003C739064